MVVWTGNVVVGQRTRIDRHYYDHNDDVDVDHNENNDDRILVVVDNLVVNTEKDDPSSDRSSVPSVQNWLASFSMGETPLSLSLSLFYHPLFYHPYNQCGWMEDERRFIHWNVLVSLVFVHCLVVVPDSGYYERIWTTNLLLPFCDTASVTSLNHSSILHPSHRNKLLIPRSPTHDVPTVSPLSYV